MKKFNNSNVTIIIPALNEEKNIARVLEELKQEGYHQILVVDGRSRDRTVEIAKEYGANVIIQNGKGKGAALRQAFSNHGLISDAIIIMDADGSMNPKEIRLFLDALNSGAEVVKGSRFLPGGYSEDMSLIRRIGNRFFLLLVNWIWSANYTDLCYGFGAFRRESIEKLLPILRSTGFEIETEIFIKVKKLGLKIVEIPSVEMRRKHGKSNLCIFRDGIRIFKTIIEELTDSSLMRRHP
ncbi:MAG: glycosyltransferase family 2 protein [Candidatus Bathyarchaeia archaeon]